MGLAFLSGAIFLFVYIHIHQVKKIYSFGANVVMVILLGIAGLCVYEGRIESIIFDKRQGLMILRRTDYLFSKKQTWQRLDQIE